LRYDTRPFVKTGSGQTKRKEKDSSGTGTQNALFSFAKPRTQVRARLESSNPPLLPVFAIAGEDPLGICGGAGTAV
jgi:hypothetical protein